MSELSFETPEFLKLVNDEAFKEEALKQKTAEDLRELFSKNGVDMTDEAFAEFFDSVNYVRSEGTNDDFLSKVSGGKGVKRTFVDFMFKHPFITFFAFCSAVRSVALIPKTIVTSRAAVKIAEADANKAAELRKLEEIKLASKEDD